MVINNATLPSLSQLFNAADTVIPQEKVEPSGIQLMAGSEKRGRIGTFA